MPADVGKQGPHLPACVGSLGPWVLKKKNLPTDVSTIQGKTNCLRVLGTFGGRGCHVLPVDDDCCAHTHTCRLMGHSKNHTCGQMGPPLTRRCGSGGPQGLPHAGKWLPQTRAFRWLGSHLPAYAGLWDPHLLACACLWGYHGHYTTAVAIRRDNMEPTATKKVTAIRQTLSSQTVPDIRR